VSNPSLCYSGIASPVIVGSYKYKLDCSAGTNPQILTFSSSASCISTACAYIMQNTICTDVPCGAANPYPTLVVNNIGTCVVNGAGVCGSNYLYLTTLTCTTCSLSGYYRFTDTSSTPHSNYCSIGIPAPTTYCGYVKTIPGASSMQCYASICPLPTDLIVLLASTTVHQCLDVASGCPIGYDYQHSTANNY
jgi:hypothetical protein